MVTLFRSAIAATRERCAHLRENPEEGIETIEIVHEGLALNGSGPTPPRSNS